MSGSSCDFSFLSWSFSDSHAIMSGVVLQSYLCAVVSAVLCCVGLGADKCGTTGKRETPHDYGGKSDPALLNLTALISVGSD